MPVNLFHYQVYSAILINATPETIAVDITYLHPNGNLEVDTYEIPSNVSAEAPPKYVEGGLITVISNVAVDGGEEVAAPFNVSSPTKGHKFIFHEGGAIEQ